RVDGAKRNSGGAFRQLSDTLYKKETNPFGSASLQNADIEAIEIRQAHLLNSVGVHLTEFLAVPFTQHIRILEGGKRTR
ncbi:MAG: hypothetical protein EGS78_08185, partial [Bacteroidales bacterium]|nr:hypothetical protein [Bacteroidales bacterium]